jgi:2-desacetyl-2-hydroxyethyl bacteriochlorophyllide A dehydrogenase
MTPERLKDGLNELVTASLRNAGFSGQRASEAKRSVWWWLRERGGVVHHPSLGLRSGAAITFMPFGKVQSVVVDVRPPQRGEVTLRVDVTAVSPGTERARYLGLPGARVQPGYVPGFSGVGRVLEVGDDVPSLNVGARVMVPNCPHQSVVTLSASSVVPVPDGVRDEDAAFGHLGVIALQGVALAEVRGEATAILGLGVIGALAQRLAVTEGASSTVVVARSLRRARDGAPPADEILTAEDALREKRTAFPVVIEATGDPQAVQLAVALAADGGRIVLLGSARGTTRGFPLDEVRRRALRVVGAHIETATYQEQQGDTAVRQRRARRFLELVAAGKVTVSDLIDVVADPREPEVLYRRLAHDPALVGAIFDWRSLQVGGPMTAWRRLPEVRARGVDRDQPMPAPRVRLARRPSGASTPEMGLALVGCGDISGLNAAAIASAVNARLVACFDMDQTLSEDLAGRHGAVAAPSYAELLNRPDVHGVLIGVPHHLHAPLAEQAAVAGKHLIVEKPPAHDLQDAVRIVDVAERAGVRVTFCLPSRYEPSTRAARWLLDRGAVGDVSGVAASFLVERPPGYFHAGLSGRTTSDWRADPERSGGGILIMNLVHQLDLLLHLTGLAVTSVSAQTGQIESPAGIEDSIALALRFENGAVGSVQGATHVRGSGPEALRLWGEHGQIELAPTPQVYTVRALPGYRVGRWQRLALPPSLDTRAALISSFVTAVRREDPADIGPEAGLDLQAVVEAAYRSVATGCLAEPATLLQEARG